MYKTCEIRLHTFRAQPFSISHIKVPINNTHVRMLLLSVSVPRSMRGKAVVNCVRTTCTVHCVSQNRNMKNTDMTFVPTSLTYDSDCQEVQ